MKPSPIPPTSEREQARQTAAAVLETAPAIMRIVRGRMREGRAEGVSVVQFRALLYVRRNPGTDLSSVAEHLGTSMPAVSELVSRLVRDGLVVREQDPVSRRRVRLTLSDEGARQLAIAREQTIDWLASRLETAPAEQRERMEASLRELLAVLDGPPGS